MKMPTSSRLSAQSHFGPLSQTIGWMLLLLMVGCSGNHGRSATGDPSLRSEPHPQGEQASPLLDASLDNAGLPALSPCTTPQPAPQQLRRLTKTQLEAILQSLGANANQIQPLEAIRDPFVYAFTNNADRLLMDNNLMAIWQPIAEQMAALMVNRLSTEQLASCQQQPSSCWSTFVLPWAQQLFRVQTLPNELVVMYQNLFQELQAVGDMNTALQDVLLAMLCSPSFWFIQELGVQVPGPSNQFALTADELSALFALTWLQQPPTEALRAEFATALSQPDPQTSLQQLGQKYLQQASQASMTTLLSSLFRLSKLPQLSKDAGIYPAFTPSLAAAMGQESQWLIGTIVDPSNQHSFAQLFRHPTTKLPEALARHYQLPVGDNPIDIQQIPGRMPGILGHPSVLSIHADPATSSPVLRGKLIRERLFCLNIAPPPPNLDVTFRPPQDAKTTRDKFRIHSEAPACQACHRLMDPIGFGFEQFDGIGMYRATENGVQVDASGSLVGLPGDDLPFTDGPMLNQLLSEQSAVKACMVRNVLVYNMGKTSFPQDGCLIDEMMARLPNQEPSFADMFMAWLTSTSFRYRSGGP